MSTYHSYNAGNATIHTRTKQKAKAGQREDLRSGFLKQNVNVETPEKTMIKKKSHSSKQSGERKFYIIKRKKNAPSC